MNKAESALVAFVAIGSLLFIAKCSGRSDGQLEAKVAALNTAIAADKDSIRLAKAQAARDSVARVAAELEATRLRAAADVQRRRADSLTKRIQIVSATAVSIDGAAPVELPPLVVAELTELRATVKMQAMALVADTAEINRLHDELSSAKNVTAKTENLGAHTEEKATLLEESRPSWWRRFGGTIVTGSCAAGGAVLGVVVGGPAGAAIGAGAGVLLAKVALP